MAGKDPVTLALNKLSLKWCSKQEIAAFLRDKGFTDDTIREVQEKLLHWGYLDDARLAADMLAHYLTVKPLGRRMIALKMGQRGIPAGVIQETLKSYTEEMEYDTCRRLAQSLAARKGSSGKKSITAALCRSLERKGFSSRIICRLIQEGGKETPDFRGWKRGGLLDSSDNYH